MDRTQEVAGSSPANSTRNPRSSGVFCLLGVLGVWAARIRFSSYEPVFVDQPAQ